MTIDPQTNAYFCFLTPPGRSAIATTLIWGFGFREIVKTFFVSNGSGDSLEKNIHAIRYGRWKCGGDEQVTEDVVLSFLGNERISIHSHGGLISQKTIGKDLLSEGAVWVEPIEFQKFMALDFWQFQLQLALQNCATEFAALVLVEQFSIWRDFVDTISAKISNNQLNDALQEISAVLRYKEIAKHLVEPWQVVLAGAPNVGKSSLINSILGYQRVIVSPIAGTTRDVVAQRCAVDGWPIELSDTAGLRDPGDEIERQGVERAKSQAKHADCLIAIFDSSEPWSTDDKKVLDQIDPDLIVFNKCDLKVDDNFRPTGANVSAKFSENINFLLAQIIKVLVGNGLPKDLPITPTDEMTRRLEKIFFSLERNDKVLALNLLKSKT